MADAALVVQSQFQHSELRLQRVRIVGLGLASLCAFGILIPAIGKEFNQEFSLSPNYSAWLLLLASLIFMLALVFMTWRFLNENDDMQAREKHSHTIAMTGYVYTLIGVVGALSNLSYMHDSGLTLELFTRMVLAVSASLVTSIIGFFFGNEFLYGGKTQSPEGRRIDAESNRLGTVTEGIPEPEAEGSDLSGSVKDAAPGMSDIQQLISASAPLIENRLDNITRLLKYKALRENNSRRHLRKIKKEINEMLVVMADLSAISGLLVEQKYAMEKILEICDQELASPHEGRLEKYDAKSFSDNVRDYEEKLVDILVKLGELESSDRRDRGHSEVSVDGNRVTPNQSPGDSIPPPEKK